MRRSYEVLVGRTYRFTRIFYLFVLCSVDTSLSTHTIGALEGYLTWCAGLPRLCSDFANSSSSIPAVPPFDSQCNASCAVGRSVKCLASDYGPAEYLYKPKTPLKSHPPLIMTIATINDLAQELLDAVIDEVGNFTDTKVTPRERKLGTQTLKSCSLVARAWLPRAWQYLFHEVEFTSMDLFSRWQAVISHGETSPYGFAQTLHFREKTDQWVTPEAFSQILPHLVTFPRVENLIFTQYDITPLVLPLQQASVSFLQSIRYLEVDSMAMNTPKELFALIDCFPHLEDLNLGHGRVRRHHERGVYLERAAERFRGRLYINSQERENDVFLKGLAACPVRFQEVRVAESPFRQPLCDLVAACAPTLKRLQVLAPMRGNVNSGPLR